MAAGDRSSLQRRETGLAEHQADRRKEWKNEGMNHCFWAYGKNEFSTFRSRQKMGQRISRHMVEVDFRIDNYVLKSLFWKCTWKRKYIITLCFGCLLIHSKKINKTWIHGFNLLTGFSSCGSVSWKNDEDLSLTQRRNDTISRFMKETAGCTTTGGEGESQKLCFSWNNFSIWESLTHILTYLQQSPSGKTALMLGGWF